jgi:hypothetical protein
MENEIVNRVSSVKSPIQKELLFTLSISIEPNTLTEDIFMLFSNILLLVCYNFE